MQNFVDGCLAWCGCLSVGEQARALLRRVSTHVRSSCLGRDSDPAAENIADVLKRTNPEVDPDKGDHQIRIESLLLRQNAKRDIQKFYDVNLDKKFGEGSYGQVYGAVHIESGNMRAVKILRKEDAVNWNLIIAELSALFKLDHPNVLKIHEFFENEVELFMVTEACYGGEITEAIRLQGKDVNHNEAWVSVMNIFAQIVSAVHYCHLEGITHRDLKLANCLFKSDEAGVVKVIDFGLAGFSKKSTVKKDKSEFDEFMGTALYAAPEILMQKTYTQLVDNWSLGVILYILFTGVHPFRLDNEKISEHVFFERVKHNPYLHDPLEKAAVPAPVRKIIDGLLQKKPEDRMHLNDILNDPLITKPYKCPDRPQLDLMEIHSNLMTFSSLSKFEKAVLMVIAHGSHSKDLEELRKMFMQIDTNNSGKLDKDELLNGFHKITGAHTFLTTEELDAVFDHINCSGTGAISYTEWLTACMSRCLLQKDESITKAFEFFDEDKDGRLTLTELEHQLGVEESDTILHDLGSEDGTIGFNDFKEFVHHVADKRGQATESQPVLSMYAPTGFGMVSLATIEEEMHNTDHAEHEDESEAGATRVSPAARIIKSKMRVTLNKQQGAREYLVSKSWEAANST